MQTIRVKKITKKYKQQGVALIQVLLISAIISILAIRFTITAREQIEIATAFEQRVKASQQLKSTQSKIIYSLLTEKATETKKLFPNSDAWNFHGNPFTLFENNNMTIRVSIQNNAGLLSQQYTNTPFWRNALVAMGYNISEAKNIQGELKDWQDTDTDSWLIGNVEPKTANNQSYRNQRIQLPQEIDSFFVQHPQRLNKVKQISTPYAVVGLNLLYAPDALILLLFDTDIAAEIIYQRGLKVKGSAEKTIRSILSELYDDEYVSFMQGNQFKITTQVFLGEVELQETIEIKLQPRKANPVLIFARY
jgi:general secretion pathway protein K